jgi:hypothetical protein
MHQPRSKPVQVVEPRYIDGAKLTALLARLFPSGQYAVEVSGKAYSQCAPD